MEKQNRPLVVYLSKSYLTSEEELQKYRVILKDQGYKIIEYQKGTTYDERIIDAADFVLLISPRQPYLWSANEKKKVFKNLLGKGQFSEAKYSYFTNKPLFVTHGITNKSNIQVSIMGDSANFLTENGNNWKTEYGSFLSDIKTMPIDLDAYVTQYFYAEKNVKHQVNKGITKISNIKILLIS